MRALVAILALAALLLCSGFRWAPPRSLVSDFDATAALATLRELSGPAVPHPVGSRANRALRERLAARWRALGIEPQVQAGWVVAGTAVAQVENLVCVLAGTRGDTVLVAAHYDSVPAGPGVADDLSGCAIQLELARLARTWPEPRPAIAFVVTDGEEAGLLGAQLFCREHPLAKQATAVLNLEARGAAGPSLLFETGDRSAGLVAEFGRRAARPLTSSLFAAIYRLLPNDTDFTVFRAQGMEGLNLAFIGAVARYHTPADTLANLDPRTFAHHGDCALAGLAALAAPPRPPASSAWFDVLGFCVVHVPVGWLRILAGLALLAAVARAWAARRTASWPGIGIGLLACLLAQAGALGLAVAIWKGVDAAGVLPTSFVANGRPLLVAVGLAVLGAHLLVAAAFAARATRAGLVAGASLWSGILLAAGLAATRSSTWGSTLEAGLHLLLVPALGAALLPGLPAALVAGVLWFPMLFGVTEALGVTLPPAQALALAVPATLLLPNLGLPGGWRFVPGIACLLAALAGTITALKLRPYTLDQPERSNIVCVQERGATSVRARHRPLPEPALALPAVPEPEILVSADEVRGEERHLQLRVRSRRGATVDWVRLVAGEIRGAAVEGCELEPWQLRAGLRFHLAEAADLHLLVRTVPAQALEFELGDRTQHLPAGLEPYLEARPAWVTPSQDGDLHLVRCRARL